MHVKICGLKDAAGLEAAASGGARYVGLVFFGKSPRHVSIPQARALALQVPEQICKVALVVDADDAALDAILGDVPIDMLQLHGREDPARVRQIKARWGLPVMKAVGVRTGADLAAVAEHAQAADQILIDAKPDPGAVLPGGNGAAFDWSILAGQRIAVPWMLAGGLHAGNLAEAVAVTGARQVDVSSGVEREKGVKDPELIAQFMAAAGALGA